ncbi:PD-(D/E)XK nuclease family transposase [Crenothrix polyspora]|uniref:Transposase n=1 Tax=Crenothrix polyspora TaxID=360316 RepID=A0A1R4H2E1_9GAMM|nr:PD-(D/E)XK nuclease family transposase [Crenothrix polyspora]SJM90412.1 hypothetical protein CRENPOLYSF1_1430001 [Crenothrix polyspora]
MANYKHLPARIVYNWADIYSQQLKSGENYGQLKPTYAIWLLAENFIPVDKRVQPPLQTARRPRPHV